MSDDDRAKRLAADANAVFDNHLCPLCIIEYWIDLINRYNIRFGLDAVDIPNIIHDLDANRRLQQVIF